MTQTNPVIILAAGEGSRFKKSVDLELAKTDSDMSSETLLNLRNTPKPMLTVGKSPIIEHILRSFSNQGFSQFMIHVSDESSNPIEDHLSQIEDNWDISYQKSTGETKLRDLLKLHLSKKGDPIISVGDSLSDANITSLVEAHKKFKRPITATSFPPINNCWGGIAVMDKRIFTPKVIDGIEKDYEKKHGKKPSKTQSLTKILGTPGNTFVVPVTNFININLLDDWKKINQIWESGRAYWPGAYAINQPENLGINDLETLNTTPKPGKTHKKRKLK